MINDFIDIWPCIKVNKYYGASINERYLNIINDIFLQYIEKSEYIKKINDASALTPPGNHYIADLSIQFKKETAPGEWLILEKKADGDGFKVCGVDEDGQVHFMAEGLWKKY